MSTLNMALLSIILTVGHIRFGMIGLGTELSKC